MDRNKAWITPALAGVIVLISCFFSVGGLAGIEKDPGVSMSVIGLAVLIAAPMLWFSYRRSIRKPVLGVELSDAASPRGSAFPSVLRSAPDLPYEVRVRGMELAMIVLTCGLGLIAAVTGLATDLGGHGAGLGLTLLRLMLLAIAAGCAYRLWLLRTPWLVLYPDRLEARGLVGWKTINRAETEGVRAAGSDRMGALFEVVPNRSEIASVRIRQKLRDDDPTIGRWFLGVRDLTAEAIAADKSAVLSDPRYGATQADRAKRLSYAKTVALVFNLACVALAAWIYFYPKPYLAASAAVIAAPLVGALIVWGSDGLILWRASKARPAVAGALAPALGVSLWSLLNLHLIGASQLIAAALALGLLAGVVAFVKLTTITRRWNAILGVVLVAALLGYGIPAQTNVALDRSAAQVFPLRVQGKSVTGSRSRSYNLAVGPWSDQPGGDVSVPASFYDDVPVGGAVCFYRHVGGFGIKWFEVDHCPAGVSPPLDQSSFYPSDAARANKGGRAQVECAVVDGHLTACRALSESPPGFGFGEAAVRRLSASDSGINPAELKGRRLIRTTVVFKMGS